MVFAGKSPNRHAIGGISDASSSRPLLWVNEGKHMRTDTQARIQAEVRARLQAAGRTIGAGRHLETATRHLEAAGRTLEAAGRTWADSRPGILVQQYRGSEFHGRTKHAVRVRFRIPLADDPAPSPRRLAAVAGWAGVLGFAGAVAALPLLANLFRPDGGWYRPVMTLIGLIGVSATAGAFASIHRRRAPWIMLWAATATLGAAMIVNALH
jgi:hypothetical protein